MKIAGSGSFGKLKTVIEYRNSDLLRPSILREGAIMEKHIFIMYGISSLSLIFGFVALLTQKIYVDSETNQPTEIEIPVLGKMKTNIPAIVFVFVGFGLAFITFNKCFPPKQVDWTITGSFIKTEDTDIDWKKGTITLVPSDTKVDISDKGAFLITVKIDEGKTFEDVVERIDYSHPNASFQIEPEKEYKEYLSKNETLIESITRTTRKFKPTSIYSYKGE